MGKKRLTGKGGIEIAQSPARFFSIGIIDVLSISDPGSVGCPVPIQRKRVLVSLVKWKINDGEPGRGEGTAV